jgi:DNA-binding MarR family transcriptional regulator
MSGAVVLQPVGSVPADDGSSPRAGERAALWAELDHALQRIRQQLDRQLQAAVGLLASDYDLLEAVDGAAGSATMGQLARTVVRSPSGVTRAVTRLAADGLLDVDARRLGATGPDRRLSYVRLTPSGRERLERARPVVAAEIERRFGRHLDPVATDLLLQVASRL